MVDVIQTYQGYFQEDGRFIVDGLTVSFPVKRRAIVNVLDDEVIPNEVSLAERREAFEALRGIIPADFKYTLEEIRDERIKKRGLVE